MKRRSILGLISACALGVPTLAAYAGTLTPGRPANVIILTNGSYLRYRQILLTTMEGLRRLGIINWVPTDNDDQPNAGTADVWAELAAKAGGSQLKFLPDGHYTYNFDPDRREKVRSLILSRIKEQKDVDLILTFGTEPSLDMAKNITDIPVLSVNSSDPVAFQIVKSADDSGQDNLHALVTENYFAWQVRCFHSIFRFGFLGLLAAEDRVKQAGADEVETACTNLGSGFTIVTYKEDSSDKEASYQALKKGLEDLLDQGVDAVMLPWFDCPDDRFSEFLAAMTSRGIPCFSQVGTEPVSRGILLGVGDTNLDNYGFFEAQVISQVLQGTKPRSINQRYIQSNGLAINLKTAMQMGWKPPFGLLLTVEKAYTTQSPAVH